MSSTVWGRRRDNRLSGGGRRATDCLGEEGGNGGGESIVYSDLAALI